MFIKASRIKLRFESPKGLLTVEDLWDLPLTSATGKANLDDIAKAAFQSLKGSEVTSFVVREVTADPTVQLRFDIAKHIIDTRLAENAAANLAAVNKERKQQFAELIARKRLEQDASKSIEELEALYEKM
jgi:hypothetical protein